MLAFGLAACGGDDSSSTDTGSSAAEASAQDGSGGAGDNSAPAGVYRADTEKFQELLFDEFGYTLYRFDKDKGSTSTCYGACAKEWPPLLTEGKPVAYAVIPSKLGTTERKDGTTQVTYFGHPLYNYVGDQEKGNATGEVLGQGVKSFGGTWYAIHRNGKDLNP
jgi:predicted lipoprotein with Yx(FWY)xxD motif